MQRSIRLSLCGAIALALAGTAATALAQAAQQAPPPPPPPPAVSMPQPPAPPTAPTPPAPPMMPQPPAPPAATSSPMQPATPTQFAQGTESSATYPLPNSHGGTLTVRAGMPAGATHYGPAPAFKSLDANHNGRISESEAQAYPPLDSDFLDASRGGKSISKAQYQKWIAQLQ